MPCIGGAISRDIKHSIIPYLDNIEPLAARIQSVNTVIVLEGRLNGFNTDAMGFRHAIVNGLKKVTAQSAVCYGYGGVASVVTSVLGELGLTVYITGRNTETAATRAAELGVHLWEGQGVDLFVNATPASESPLEQAPHFLDALASCKIVFDHEMPGKYLQEHCSKVGVLHIPGLDMYYPQMQEQWKLFLEGIADADSVAALLQQAEPK
ncbi:hypothetical protein B484DRAFT_456861 [Ochromonadaceae sp. CCMP2298]|nr:hypothetical protein B484DRAFT_456861 [Ochromonadaceae sp. CCMP2298]